VGTLLAVDGNSLGHRAFHARAQDAPSGPHVTGTFVRMLASAWAQGPYDAVVVGFDAPDNRRKDQYPEYKAGRAPSPPGLREQLQALREHLTDCGLAVIECPGAEADDVLAAAADTCLARDWRCDLLSSDRDLTALVGPRVRLLRPRATMSDLVIDDEAGVRRAYGIEPWQYTDLAALRGDPSDGLDGVHGIGPKTAARLLRDHGSVPGIYASLHDLEPRLEAALRAGRERVERNLLLMAPIPRLDVDVEQCLAAAVDPERVESVLGPLGLASAARRLAGALRAPALPPMPPPPTEEAGGQPMEFRRPARDRVLAPSLVGEQAALF
jgi:5'-3' exonuclease